MKEKNIFPGADDFKLQQQMDRSLSLFIITEFRWICNIAINNYNITNNNLNSNN